MLAFIGMIVVAALILGGIWWVLDNIRIGPDVKGRRRK